jgi:hypothetical protein
LADQSKKDRANNEFKKHQRAEEGKRAMSDYEAEAAAVRANTARLKALRLARDAAEAARPAPVAAPTKKPAKKAKAAPVKLSAWLDGEKKSGRNN